MMTELKIPKGNWLFVTGLALVLLGIGAMISPAFAGNTVVYLIGALMLITGLIQLLAAWQEETWREKLANLTLGGIAAVGGIAVLAHPFYGLAALTLVLAIFFCIEGVWKIVSSFSYRPVPGWLALILSGVLDLILGILIWRQWPVSGLWAVGILVGVNLFSTGIAFLALALTWKRAVHEVKNKVEVVKERIAQRSAESDR
jgi:membrane protein HdeD